MDIHSSFGDYIIRDLKITDFSKGYKALLEDLTVTGNLDEVLFEEIFVYRQRYSKEYYNIVIEEETTGLVVGNGVLFVKHDFTKARKKVGLIEDIVILKRLQGKGLGKKIIDTLLNIASAQSCHQVVLDCSEVNEGFYSKCGFRRIGLEMGLYF
jgi:GNAT superfamily N-acetyltransferase